MATNLGTPYGDRILVKRDEVQEKLASGIIIHTSSQEKPTTGTIVAVGKGRVDSTGKRIPMGVKVGDRIRFNDYGNDELKLEGETYILMREDAVTFLF